MEIKVKAYSYDYLNNQELLIKDGIGYLFDDNYLTYLEELGEERVRHEIKWDKDEVELKRVSENISVTKLKLQEYKEASVDTAYGNLKFDTYLKNFKKNDDLWSVEYMLFNDGHVIAHSKVTWELSGSSQNKN